MLYLIGGAPRCGKTTLAKSLATATSFNYLSTDELASAIKPYISESAYPEKLPMYVAWKDGNGNNDTIYTANKPDAIAQCYQIQAETYWPGIRNFLADAAYDELNYIVEGYQITPAFVSDFVEAYPDHKIVPIFLYKEAIPDIVTGLKANKAAYDWVLKYTKEESTYTAIATMVAAFGKRTLQEANQCNYRAVNMDRDFYEIIGRLTEELRLQA